MAAIQVSDPVELARVLLSLMTFTQDAKLVFSPEGVKTSFAAETPVRMYTEYSTNLMISDEPVTLCIKEIQRLYRAISMVVESRSKENEHNPMSMKVSPKADVIEYDGKDGNKFRINAVMESALAGNTDAVGAIASQQYSYTIGFNADRLKNLFKQAPIVRSKDPRIYMILDKSGQVFLQLEDRKAHHAGMVSVPLADKVDSGEFVPAILNMAVMRMVLKLPSDHLYLRRLVNGGSIAVQSFTAEDKYEVKAQVIFSSIRD